MKRAKRTNKHRYSKYLNTNDDKSAFTLLLESIINAITHKIYFIFVPHSKKRSKSISIPIYSLIIIIVVVLTVVFTCLTLLTRNIILVSQTKTLEGTYEELLNSMKVLEGNSIFISESSEYRDGILSLFEKGNFDVKSIFTNYTSTNVIDIIKQMTFELDESMTSLDDLETILLNRKKNIANLPTILPVTHKNIVIARPFQEGPFLPKSIKLDVITGTDIRVTANGVIEDITFIQDEGFTVTVSHALAITTRYIGLATTIYSVDDKVDKASILGKSKNNYIEYQVKVVFDYVNPLLFTYLIL